MNSCERSQSLRDHQQVGFIMLNKFWSLTKKPFTLLFLTDNIKLDGMPARIKLKIQACFTLYFKFWEGTLWKVMRYMYQFFYFLFRIRLYISRYHFLQRFRTSFNFIWKRFWCKFSFFNGLTQTPKPFNIQNLLSVRKVFVNFP